MAPSSSFPRPYSPRSLQRGSTEQEARSAGIFWPSWKTKNVSLAITKGGWARNPRPTNHEESCGLSVAPDRQGTLPTTDIHTTCTSSPAVVLSKTKWAEPRIFKSRSHWPGLNVLTVFPTIKNKEQLPITRGTVKKLGKIFPIKPMSSGDDREKKEETDRQTFFSFRTSYKILQQLGLHFYCPF